MGFFFPSGFLLQILQCSSLHLEGCWLESELPLSSKQINPTQGIIRSNNKCTNWIRINAVRKAIKPMSWDSFSISVPNEYWQQGCVGWCWEPGGGCTWRAAPEVEKVVMVTIAVWVLGNLNIKSHFGGIGHEKGAFWTLTLPVLDETKVWAFLGRKPVWGAWHCLRCTSKNQNQ